MASDRGTVRLCGFLRCGTAEDSSIVERHLPDHVALTRAEPGCLSFEVSQTDDPLVWRVEEVFTDQAAFTLHQERTRSSMWFEATGHIRRDYTIGDSGGHQAKDGAAG